MWRHLAGASGHEVFSLKIFSLKWNLLHGQATSCSTAPFLYLGGFSHICNKHRPYWSWTLSPYCKKACFATRAQCVPWAKMATVPSHSFQKYLSGPSITPEKCRPHTMSAKQSWAHSCFQKSMTHSLPFMLLGPTDTPFKFILALCITPEEMLGRTKKNKDRVEHIHVTRGHWHPFKLILSLLHAGLSLACSVASLGPSLQSLPAKISTDYSHDSFADCKLKGDELSTWVSGHSNNSCTPLPCPDVTGRCIPSTSPYSSLLEGHLGVILLCLVPPPAWATSFFHNPSCKLTWLLLGGDPAASLS